MRVRLWFPVALALATTPGSLAAQDTTTDTSARASVEREDSLRLQRRLSAGTALGVVVPGAGLAYAGRFFHAYAAFVGSLGMITTGVMTIMLSQCPLDFSGPCRPTPSGKVLGTVGGVAFIGTGFWIWRIGVVAARREIRKQEERRRARRDRSERFGSDVFVAPPVAPAGQWLVGIRATW